MVLVAKHWYDAMSSDPKLYIVRPAWERPPPPYLLPVMDKISVTPALIFLQLTLVTAGLATYVHGMLIDPPPVPLKADVVFEIVTSGLSKKIRSHENL